MNLSRDSCISSPYPCIFCVFFLPRISCNSNFTVHLNFLQYSNIQLTYLKGVTFLFIYCQYTQAMFSECVELFFARCSRNIQPKNENLAKWLQACKIKLKDLVLSLLNTSHILNTLIYWTNICNSYTNPFNILFFFKL